MFNLPLFLVQIFVILAVARMVGLLFRKIHQPQVIGEMFAGILLGPSLLGWAAPELFTRLFPVDSLGYLNALSQIGLILFMFLVGLELDPRFLRGRGHTALVTSNVSILAPFFLGALLAYYLYPRLADDSIQFSHFALFIGTAMSITAFPVLARILGERNLLRTQLGALAIACAAVNDVTGWLILAGVVLLVRSSEAALPLWATLLGVAAYAAFMLVIVRRIAQRQEHRFEQADRITPNILAVIFLVLLFSSLVTEMLGIHALFGAFLAGFVMPKHPNFVHAITEKLNDVAVVLLLPIFFALTGLRTSIGLVSGVTLWFYTALIILAAILGKFGGSAVAARVTGVPWREASALGILMNTRGLMELVLLTIGLEIGVLTPTLFTMLVIMALVTTFMTAPGLEWIYYKRVRPGEYPLTAAPAQTSELNEIELAAGTDL